MTKLSNKKTPARPAARKAAPKKVVSSRPAPRPNAERSAETRTRVLDSAIACLARVGYSATTISMVCDEAQVSRGAMTHQFPSKNELMLEVVLEVYRQDSEYYRQVFTEKAPRDFLLDMPRMMWGIIGRPAGVAVMEIMLAARSDRDLANRLRKLQRGIDTRAHAWIAERMAGAGVHDRPDGEIVHRLFVSAVRGLTMESTFRRDPKADAKTIALLGEILSLLYPKLSD